MRQRRDRMERSLIHVHRIPDGRVVLLGALHRFLEALVENSCAVLLAGHLAVALFLHLALLRLEARHHRLQRAAGAPLLRLVQQHLAGGAVDDERRFAAGTSDFDIVGHSAAHPDTASACVKSSTRSSACSSPTETRSRFSAFRLPTPSLDARCSIRLSVPPSDVARVKIFVFAVTACASARPPRTLNDNMPPNDDICRAAIAWPACDSSPG